MRIAVVLVVSSVALAGCPAPRPAPPKSPAVEPPSTLDPAAIDDWISHELERRGVVGAALVIVHEGASVFAKGYGTRQVHFAYPVTPDTPFAIGSVSKQFACAAAYLLADDGKLRMDDPVAKYYPDLTRAADITLDDLGAHQSGYRDYYPLDYMDARMAHAIEPDALIAKYAGLPLDFEPRSRRSYSNTGFVILARVVERVSGMKYGEFLERRIFARANMAHTGIGPPGDDGAKGHTGFLLGPVATSANEATGWLFGAADLHASANDLASWDLAFSTSTLLSEASRKAMTTPHQTSDRRIQPYGCGLGVRVDQGETVLSHTGAIEGFFAYNTFVPRTRSAVVLLANDNRSDLADLQRALVDLVLQRPGDIPVIPGPSAETVARTLIRELQRGSLDRSRLGDDLSAYWDAARIADAARRLAPLGEPTVRLTGRRERGAMEVTALDVVFARRTVRARMFRAPTGKIHQFLLLP